MKRIAVFSGSSPGVQPDYMIAAKRLAETLVSRSHALVYGGANVGLMGELARSVKALGGEVIGVIPRSLVEKEVAYRELHDLRIVESMHERKAVIADLSDGFGRALGCSRLAHFRCRGVKYVIGGLLSLSRGDHDHAFVAAQLS